MTDRELHTPEAKLFVGLFDAIPFGIYVVDIETLDLIYTNGLLKENLPSHSSKKCYEAIYNLSSPCSHCNIKKLKQKKTESPQYIDVYQHFNECNDRWYQMQDKSLTWPDGREAKYSIAVDITDMKEVQNRLAEAHAELAINNRKLAEAAITDMLTQLNNRLKLEIEFEREMERCERYNISMSIILIDLDNFKAVNDNFGHPVGDVVLIESAKRFKKSIRGNDILGRWGGEEFMVICPETNLEAGLLVAEKLRSTLADSDFPVVGPVTGSFGLAHFQKGDTIKELISRSDQALYTAKSDGRNCVRKL